MNEIFIKAILQKGLPKKWTSGNFPYRKIITLMAEGLRIIKMTGSKEY
jgi:hypothetical protein